MKNRPEHARRPDELAVEERRDREVPTKTHGAIGGRREVVAARRQREPRGADAAGAEKVGDEPGHGDLGHGWRRAIAGG